MATRILTFLFDIAHHYKLMQNISSRAHVSCIAYTSVIVFKLEYRHMFIKKTHLHGYHSSLNIVYHF